MGSRGEDLAVIYLKREGYEILARNYRLRSGEIDIIAKEGGEIVFCEVKTRKDAGCGDPTEAVDIAKIAKIQKMAAVYLYTQGYEEDTSCRIDVVGICGSEITHLKNVTGF